MMQPADTRMRGIMKRSTVALAALALAAATAAQTGAAVCAQPRHFVLAEGDGGAKPGVVRFFSQAVELADGATQSWVTVTRTGTFTDPRYGQFDITPAMLAQMVDNFNKRTLGQDVFIDVAHKPNDGAAAKVLKLAVENGRLRALVEWTAFGMDAVRNKGFAYLSAEFHESFVDNEKQLPHGCVLLGAGLTLRPVIKHLEPVTLSQEPNDHAPDGMRVAISPQLLAELTKQPNSTEQSIMQKRLSTLLAACIALGFTKETSQPLIDGATKALTAVKDDDAKMDSVVDQFKALAETAMAQIKTLGAQGDGKQVNITLAAPVDVAGEVAKQLAANATAAAASQTALAGKLKLLSDTIADGDKTLTPEGVKKFADDYAPMVTAVTTDEQVKHLAALAVKQAQAISAAQKLVTLGYAAPSGSVHITVDSSNETKSLQATLDKRLGLTREDGDTKRFYATGGKLLAANKEFADKVLAEFDAANGVRLHQEHKALAAGTGTISDIKAPASVERTVLREALYNLVSLNFMDVGTSPMAPSVQIPYSYRDTTAAGTLNTRIYERQSIQKGGMIQTWDTAYPIPQKLAFNISNEMQYLLGASPINYDPISENVNNLVRILGEDTEALNLNEIVRAGDEYAVTTITDTLTAQVDGTNKIFVTTKFPVVRPRTQYDLQGGVAVAKTNGVTVTLNSVVRNEYLPNPDGTALATATYWVMDYNLGELRFVDQTGAAVTPTSAWVLTVAYSYTTNVAKIDLDLGSLTVAQKYDAVLTALGARKVVIEDDRYYTGNMVLMTGGVDNAIGQATTFTANGARVGTTLNADGSIGMTKGMSTYKVRGPGLLINDNRIVVGESRNSRFRMCRAFAMGQLQDARSSGGAFIGAKEGYGEQYVVSHTPVNRKLATTSLILYSATGRVARAA